MTTLYQGTLIDIDSIVNVVQDLRAAFTGKRVSIKETFWNGEVEVHENVTFVDDSSKAATFAFAYERHHPTTAHYFGLILTTMALHFYTCDDVMVEWLAPTTVKITNTKKPRNSGKPMREVIITVLEEVAAAA